ncbi:riboflavin synthase [Mycobacterium haemophilum]
MPESSRKNLTTAPRDASTLDLIGVVDTMFARHNMGAEAIDALKQCSGYGTRFEVVRRTVPGLKDLAVAAKKLIEEQQCRAVIALGMASKGPLGLQCAREASRGLMQAQLMTNTHILEVIVWEDRDEDLNSLFRNLPREHAINAYALLYEPDTLIAHAGHGTLALPV